MTTSVHIAKGQGLTQALKSYAQQNGYDVSRISKQNWTNTINELETIQKSREENNLNSIYTEVNSSKPYGNMLVKEGNIEFSEGEMQSLFTAMGLQLKTETPAADTVQTEPEAAQNNPETVTAEPEIAEAEPAEVETPANPAVEDSETKADKYESWTTDISLGEKDDSNVFQFKSDDSHDADSYNKDLAKLAEEYIEKYDTDGDGEISFDEFKKYELSQIAGDNIDEKSLKSAEKTLKTTFKNLNVETEETKDTLDKREIMNFFFSTDSLDSDDFAADGSVSGKSYKMMSNALADNGSDGKTIKGFLSRNFQAFFKNFGN